MERIALQQAIEILLARTNKIKDTECVSLWDAAGRILAEDAIAQRNQPPFPRSPLDGYAVRSADVVNTSKESPVKLTVIDEVTAGHVSEKNVEEGTAIRIMTGAPIPLGADGVIRQEDTDYGEAIVEVYKGVKAYQNYCYAGEDYEAGAKLLNAGCVLGSVEIGVLASLGMDKVQVYRRPKAALITTGDEILLPGETLLPGKIFDSNLYALGSRLMMWNLDVIAKDRAEDDAEVVAEKIRNVAEDADIIITTGGVSVGKKDIMHDVLNILECERLFWKISIKPGMPTLCAMYNGKLLICLSGNPFGATVNLELLVRPLLEKMTGNKKFALCKKQAVTKAEFLKPSPVTRYVRAFYRNGEVSIPEGSNASGILSSMAGCNALIEIPAGTEAVNVGDKVWVVVL